MKRNPGIPTLSSELIWRAMEDGLVIVSPEEGKVRVLNESASFIWTLIDGQRSVHEIAKQLSQEYEVTTEQALQDVGAFLNTMAKSGLVSWTT